MAGPSIPGYERLTQIGKGGFSRVYRGEQAKLKRGVAIKVLNFGLNDEADRRSFERECELMGRVSTHPNIVTVHDTAFTADGQPCIVMEHYPGGSLADLISEVRHLNTKEVLEVGVAIAAALEASHQAGVLHCDLKPQNILISEFGQPALGDFGISTFSEERTRTGGDAGAGFTLAYAAPEIVEGASPSIESDVYSLAATLYTSLAGRRPFYYLGSDGSKPTAAEQARRILLEQPAPLTEYGVPSELDQVIRDAMQKTPSDRPSSAVDFAQSLYQVGVSLGLGIAPPRIASRGALPVLDPRADFTDQSLPQTAAASAAPVAPAAPDAVSPPVVPEASDDVFEDDGTVLRELIEERTELRNRSDVTALRADPIAVTPPQPQVEAEPLEVVPVSDEDDAQLSRRRQLAPVVGIIGLLLFGGVLFFVNRGESTTPAAAPTPVPNSAPQAEVLLAPPPPRDVTATRVGPESVLLTWSNEPEDGVMYEIRHDGGTSEWADSPALAENVDPDQASCFTVLAVRSNRLSPAGDQACVGPRNQTYVQATPQICVEPCVVLLDLFGFPTDLELGVRVEQAASTEAVSVAISGEVTTDSDGKADSLSIAFEPDADPGVYLVHVAYGDVGEFTTAAITLASDASG